MNEYNDDMELGDGRAAHEKALREDERAAAPRMLFCDHWWVATPSEAEEGLRHCRNGGAVLPEEVVR
jgi:hypothetical protein